MAISERPAWHNNDEEILAFKDEYPDIYDFVLKVLDGHCSEETRDSISDEYGVEFVDTVMKIITDKATAEDIEEFLEEWGDDFYLPIKNIIQKKAEKILRLIYQPGIVMMKKFLRFRKITLIFTILSKRF